MELALYGDGGFYVTAGRAGRPGGRAGRRHGDFLTSPEVGPLFGAVLARHLDAEWERIGRPDPFTVVDAGAGPGTLARAVSAAAPACAPVMRYVAVEVSAAQRSSHPAGIVSCAELPAEPVDGVVVANELLDNLPFRLAVFSDGWREAFVALDGDRFVEVLSGPFDPVPAALPAVAAHGARAALVGRAAAWVTTARRLVRAGSVLVLDYTRSTTDELASEPWREWLRTYRGHERGGHYLDEPGGQDITTDVPLDQLPAADLVTTQAEWLVGGGIDELVGEGHRVWQQAASRPDVAALTMRSRRREADALTDLSGLGAFTVLEWRT